MVQSLTPEQFFNTAPAKPKVTAATQFTPEEFFNSAGSTPIGESANLVADPRAELPQLGEAAVAQNIPNQDIAGRGRTVLDQSLQGATFGFADEASDYLGQGMAKIYASLSPSITRDDLPSYDQTRTDSQARLQNEMATRPALSIGANLGGALLTGGIGASTKTGAAIGNSLRTGGIAARGVKAGAIGAATGGLSGFGTGEDGLENRLQSAKDGALLGGAIGYAAPGVGAAVRSLTGGSKTIGQGIAARTGEELKDTAASMKTSAVGLKSQAELNKIVLDVNEGQQLSSSIDEALSGTELIPEFSPKTLKVVQLIKEKAASGELNLNNLDQYRRLLRGAYDEDGVASGAVRRAIDKTVNGLSEEGRNGESVKLLNQFRKDYSKASKFEDLADLVTKADGDPNKIKSSLTRFMNKPENTLGWNQEELAALKNAASSSAPEKVLKMLGKFGFDLGTSTTAGNTVAPIIGGSAAAGFGSTGAGIAVPIVGTAARQTQKYLARGKLEQLLKVVESGGKVSPSELKALPKQEQLEVIKVLSSKMKPSQADELQAVFEGKKRTQATIRGYGKK